MASDQDLISQTKEIIEALQAHPAAKVVKELVKSRTYYKDECVRLTTKNIELEKTVANLTKKVAELEGSLSELRSNNTVVSNNLKQISDLVTSMDIPPDA